MKIYPRTRPIHRYIALDIHKEYVFVGGMNVSQEWILPARRIELSKFGEWARKNLCERDAVVLETTTNVWDIYEVLQPWAGHTVVAHAGGVRQIAEARVKTDKEDFTPALAGGARERLIYLLIADILPEAWVPPQPVRELRGLVSYRQRLVKTGAMIRNRLQSLLHKRNLLLPDGGLTDKVWWEQQTAVSAMEKLQIQQELCLLEQIEKHKAEVDQELAR